MEMKEYVKATSDKTWHGGLMYCPACSSTRSGQGVIWSYDHKEIYLFPRKMKHDCGGVMLPGNMLFGLQDVDEPPAPREWQYPPEEVMTEKEFIDWVNSLPLLPPEGKFEEEQSA